MTKVYAKHKCEVCDTITSNKTFCSAKCRASTQKSKVQTRCPNCNTLTFNPKFCSQSCAAIFNNSKNPKRKKRVWHCERCGQIKERKTKYQHICDDCLKRPRRDMYKYKTTGDLRSVYKSKGWHRQNVFTYIREQARRIYKKSKPSTCVSCGYTKHVEICHIKQVSEYPDDALISEINSLDNLVALCPNCHWEFDHGLLKL